MFTKATLLDPKTGRDTFNRVAFGEFQRRTDGSLWRTSRSYVVTDPDSVAEKIRRDGMAVDIVAGTRALGMDARRSAVLVCRVDNVDEYAENVSILLDHSGKHAIRLIPNVWRRSCSNEFYGSAAVRIYHCSREARDFAEDPVPFVRESFSQLRALGEFMRVGAFEAPASPDLWLEIAKHKRLARQVWRAQNDYRKSAQWRGKDPESAWVQLQSLTAVKSPTTIRWAHEYLTGKWPVSQ